MLTLIEQLELLTINEEIMGRYWMRRPTETHKAIFANSDIESGIESAAVDKVNDREKHLRHVRDMFLICMDVKQMKKVIQSLPDDEYEFAKTLSAILHMKNDHDDARHSLVSFIERMIVGHEINYPEQGAVQVSPLIKQMREPSLGRPSLKRSMGL